MGAELRLVYSPGQIAASVGTLARRIGQDYAGEEVVLVVVLKGALFFAADLARQIGLPLSMEFVKLKSYSGTSSTGTVVITKDLDGPIAGKHVLVVEDIVDTGLTLQFLLAHLNDQGARSVKVCTLLDKSGRRQVEVAPDYVGISCENRFLVGYGLDFDERYRELPAIYELIP
ncbi:hypoxanthine phosphoribosyltransferase [Geomobilimonas luticola]|uniref:Hypoxanthine phosphoribosyltransferase n=1 Tax=Geomobilimonas luticola TaxID=1114878 RepID=A0ABS5SGK2_9BACT|nr:hypoxanthine phosphoribosyltransferase [Geomobilimonas luticola]MBT0654490.1 hypoxanthine phosphoribosyltransferase [Geomobilimonas luticola]